MNTLQSVFEKNQVKTNLSISNIVDLFPSAFYHSDFYLDESVRQNLLMNERVNNLLNQSNFEDLKLRIDEEVNGFANQYFNHNKQDISFFLTTSKLVVRRPKEFVNRSHALNSIISGVLILDAPVDSGQLYFYKKNDNWFNFTPEKYNVYNSDNIGIVPTTGKLFLFPSNLEYSFGENKSFSNASHILFNYFFKGRFISNEGEVNL